MPVGKYRVSPPTWLDGEVGFLSVDSQGRLLTAPGAAFTGLTNAQFTAVAGTAAAAAWDGVAASATMVAILKSIDAQLRIIAANTATP